MPRRPNIAQLLAAALLGVLACADDTAVSAPVVPAEPALPVADPGPPRVLLYTKETEWFHPSTQTGTQVMSERGRARGWAVTVSKESSVMTADSLAKFDVVFFLNSSGMTMEQPQRDAFASYIAQGHGWVGVHAASHTDYNWAFMKDLVGALFCCHPPMVEATSIVQDTSDPIVSHLPPKWTRSDEWYTYDHPPEQGKHVKVLLAMDESSVRPDYPGPDLSPFLRVGFHATTWKNQFGATRVFYTGMGHTPETWQDESFVVMMLKAVEWAAGHGQ